jgi:hypothetical protein
MCVSVTCDGGEPFEVEGRDGVQAPRHDARQVHAEDQLATPHNHRRKGHESTIVRGRQRALTEWCTSAQLPERTDQAKPARMCALCVSVYDCGYLKNRLVMSSPIVHDATTSAHAVPLPIRSAANGKKGLFTLAKKEAGDDQHGGSSARTCEGVSAGNKVVTDVHSP